MSAIDSKAKKMIKAINYLFDWKEPLSSVQPVVAFLCVSFKAAEDNGSASLVRSDHCTNIVRTEFFTDRIFLEHHKIYFFMFAASNSYFSLVMAS